MIIDCAHYRDGVRQATEPLTLEQAATCRAQGDGFVWLGLLDPGEDELTRAQRIFGLHELAVDDTRAKHSRPKFEQYEGHYFVVLRTARYDDENERVEFGEVQLFLGSGFAVLVREGKASELATARRGLEARPDLLAAGPVAVLWGVVDKIVDDDEPVVRGLEPTSSRSRRRSSRIPAERRRSGSTSSSASSATSTGPSIRCSPRSSPWSAAAFPRCSR